MLPCDESANCEALTGRPAPIPPITPAALHVVATPDAWPPAARSRDAGSRRPSRSEAPFDDVAAVGRLRGHRPQDQRSLGPLAAARLKGPEDRHGQRHGGRSGALADQVQDTVTAQCLGVVLDPDRGGLRRAEDVDAEKIRQRAGVPAQRLGNLQEPDQLKPIEALSAGLIGVDLRQPGVGPGRR